MKRLLLVSSEFPPGPGGIGTHAYQFSRHMQALGWDVSALVMQDYANKEEVIEFNRMQDFEIISLLRARNKIKDIWMRWQILFKIINTRHPDVVVVSGDRLIWLVAFMQIYARLIHQDFKLKWCAIWHGVIPPQRIQKKISAWAFGQADVTISVSQYSLKQLTTMDCVGNFVVITNGADEQRYQPDLEAGMILRDQLGIRDAFILLTVGHVSERKGQDIVIRALPEILKSIPAVHYLIVGLPTLQKSLEKLAYELGVLEHVHFLGNVSAEALYNTYNSCDVFILTSRHSSNGEFEGYGIVAVEAALCAKPSIVAGNSGLAEAVLDGQTGFIVPENDPGKTSDAVKKLLIDNELRKNMGESARRNAFEHQTWSVCISQYNDVLSSLAASDK